MFFRRNRQLVREMYEIKSIGNSTLKLQVIDFIAVIKAYFYLVISFT